MDALDVSIGTLKGVKRSSRLSILNKKRMISDKTLKLENSVNLIAGI